MANMKETISKHAKKCVASAALLAASTAALVGGEKEGDVNSVLPPEAGVTQTFDGVRYHKGLPDFSACPSWAQNVNFETSLLTLNAAEFEQGRLKNPAMAKGRLVQADGFTGLCLDASQGGTWQVYVKNDNKKEMMASHVDAKGKISLVEGEKTTRLAQDLYDYMAEMEKGMSNFSRMDFLVESSSFPGWIVRRAGAEKHVSGIADAFQENLLDFNLQTKKDLLKQSDIMVAGHFGGGR